MNDTILSKSDIFEGIEDLYFSDRFKEVVEFWECHNIHYQIDNKSIDDLNILEAVATSYYETGMYEKSLLYRDLQIKHLKMIEMPSHEKVKKCKYYYLSKLSVYKIQNKRILEYKTACEYLKSYKNDVTFQELTSNLEKYFYKKYSNFIKGLGYITIGCISIAIILPLLKVSIPKNIYTPYNIISIICVIWLVFNILFPRTIKKYLIYAIRQFCKTSGHRL